MDFQFSSLIAANIKIKGVLMPVINLKLKL